MTNREKFVEIFKQEPDDSVCPLFCSDCFMYKNKSKWEHCEAGDWWNMEYKGE